jgi:DNA repair photolyase
VERSFISGYKPYIARRNYPRVRCSFTLLAWANGCMYDCGYCWLKAYHPWPWTEVHVAEKPSLARVLRRFCAKIGVSQLLNSGELCDSFVAHDYVPFMASVIRQANEEYGRSHRLLLLTKSADPWPLLKNSYQDVIVYSISVNTETVAKQLEHGAPSPNKRAHAAMRIRGAGYEVRVRVDPIIAGSNPAYTGLMERICTFTEPSLITLGTLRATPRTYRSLPLVVKTQLTEKTPWGRGYPLEARLSFYNELIDVARRYGIPVALCKEPSDVWRRLKLRSKCNCMP